jgi:hypothetical protein
VAHPSAELFEDNADTEHDTDFDPSMLTNAGYYAALCGVVMKLTLMFKTTAAD